MKGDQTAAGYGSDFGDFEHGSGNEGHEAEGHEAVVHETDHGDGEGETDTNPFDRQCSSTFSEYHLTQA